MTNSIYDHSECDEVAGNFFSKAPHFNTFDEALAWVKAEMGDYGGTQINDNIAESLLNAQRTADMRETARDITKKMGQNLPFAVALTRR